ncbi:MAG TPA: hypothetical protein VFX17_02575 [Patescibacteria group bacterium]|nr:hypothetical protein [Patescibacteria group bacterium]
MGIIAILFLWPFLIIALGLVFVAFGSLFNIGLAWLFIFLALILLFILISQQNNHHFASTKTRMTSWEELHVLREMVITMSISLLIPIFTRYLLDSFHKNLISVIAGLIIGFSLTTWGMFIKNNKVLMYSNIFGGSLTIIYVYVQLWELGSLARVIAAAFGLIAAVTISTIKLKEKLS